MSKKYTDISLKNILPENLIKDSNISKIIDTVDPHILEAAGLIKNAEIFSSLDNQSEQILELLGWQFHVTRFEGWSENLNITQKAELIRNAILLHRYKGTPWSVKKAFDIIGIEATIKEWFQDGGSGEPYTFNIFLKIAEDIEHLYNALGIIDQMKNVRSKYYVDFDLLSETKMTIQSGILNDIEPEKAFSLEKAVSFYTPIGKIFNIDTEDSFTIESNTAASLKSAGIFSHEIDKADLEIERSATKYIGAQGIINFYI